MRAITGPPHMFAHTHPPPRHTPLGGQEVRRIRMRALEGLCGLCGPPDDAGGPGPAGLGELQGRVVGRGGLLVLLRALGEGFGGRCGHREREREREREKKKLAAVRGGALRLESGQARHARMRMRSRTRHSCGGQTWARESQGGRWVLLAVRALAHLADNPVLSVGGPPAFPHPSISFAIRGRGSVGLLGGPRLVVFPLFRSLCVSSV